MALDDNIGHQLVATAVSFIILSILCVLIRFSARYVGGTRIAVDDYLMSLALVCFLALCGISLAMVYAGGAGRHLAWLAEHDPVAPITYTKLTIPFTVFVAFSITFAKLCILCLYLRIFPERLYRWLTYGIMAIQIATLIETVILTFAVCMPLAFLWDPVGNPGGKCIDINTFWRWCNFPNIPTDIFMLILPIPRLRKLQLGRKDKIGVMVTFATGSIGLITSIARFAFFYNTDGTSDGTYTAAQLGSMSVSECGVYLIAGCLPVYRSLFRFLRRGGKTEYGHGSAPRSAWKSQHTELASIPSKQADIGEYGFDRPGRFDDLEGRVSIGRSDSKRSLVNAGMVGNGRMSEEVNGPRIVVRQDYVVTTSKK